MLPKHLIKKYGVSKKAWQVYRASQHTTHKRVNTMGKKKRHFSRKAKSFMGNTGTIIGAVAYGAIREKVSNALTPVTSKVPLGSIGDEVVMAGICYFASKKMGGMIGNVAKAGYMIELARIGEAIADGTAFGSTNNTSSTGSIIG